MPASKTNTTIENKEKSLEEPGKRSIRNRRDPSKEPNTEERALKEIPKRKARVDQNNEKLDNKKPRDDKEQKDLRLFEMSDDSGSSSQKSNNENKPVLKRQPRSQSTATLPKLKKTESMSNIKPAVKSTVKPLENQENRPVLKKQRSASIVTNRVDPMPVKEAAVKSILKSDKKNEDEGEKSCAGPMTRSRAKAVKILGNIDDNIKEIVGDNKKKVDPLVPTSTPSGYRKKPLKLPILTDVSMICKS